MKLRDLIPAKVRRGIYVLLAVGNAAQGAFAVVPADGWGRVLTFAAALGFTFAAGNTVPND